MRLCSRGYNYNTQLCYIYEWLEWAAVRVIVSSECDIKLCNAVHDLSKSAIKKNVKRAVHTKIQSTTIQSAAVSYSCELQCMRGNSGTLSVKSI